jgi:predicted nucleic acid-binding protein
MIAIDSSSLIAYFSGEEGVDVESVDRALQLSQAALPPVVLVEILSDPSLDREFARLIRRMPILKCDSGFWERAAVTRAKILSKKLRARLADTLIAQSCLDNEVPLVTRDLDFKHFALHAGLMLL